MENGNQRDEEHDNGMSEEDPPEEKTRRECIGYARVVSGTVILGDPRLLTDEVRKQIDAFDKNDNVYDQLYGPEETSDAVIVGDFGGDGRYPAFVTVTEAGLIKKLEIEF